MNIKIILLVNLCLLAASSFLHADDMTVKEYTDKYYQAFSQPMDDGALYVLANFDHGVPATLRLQVLDKILDRANFAQPKKAYGVMGYVFMYLRNFGSQLTLTPHLEANLYALSKDSNWMTRRDVLQVVRALGRTKDHDLIIAALNDPKDDVRAAAMNALRDRPDAEGTYQKFIQDHQSDPNYTTSVQYAKGGLEAIHESKNSSGK